MSDVILEARHLTKRYHRPDGKILTACKDLSLHLCKGETLGIIGESGCGKTTLVKLLAQLEKPDNGQLICDGTDITALRGEKLRQHRKRIQMVFQDPASAFFPRMQVWDAITEPLRNFYPLSKSQRMEKAEQLLSMVELPSSFLTRYPHSMSGGQRQRLGIARALALEPSILLCDEATAALDVSTQDQLITLLVELQKKKALSMVFVCHDLSLVQSVSHRIMVMYLGTIVEALPSSRLQTDTVHPYARALLNSVFTLSMDKSLPIEPLSGEVPSPIDRPSGCPFHTRCPDCREICHQTEPPLTEVSDGHLVACHQFDTSKKEIWE